MMTHEKERINTSVEIILYTPDFDTSLRLFPSPNNKKSTYYIINPKREKLLDSKLSRLPYVAL